MLERVNMHWRERLDRKTLNVCFAFLIIFLVLSTTCIGTVVGVNEAEMPKYSVGDKWKFTIDYKYEIGMVGTITGEVTGDSVEIYQLGKQYVCDEYSRTGNGTVYGEGITGTWTMNSKWYSQKSDLRDVKVTETWDLTFTYDGEPLTMKMVYETLYDPPLESCKGFPLTAGKSWSSTTTETTTTRTTIDRQVDQETDTTTYTRSYFILRTETTTVSAGEFDTFVRKATDADGSYYEVYYSPEVGGSVKEMYYDETGKLVVTAELLEYSYATAEEGFPLWIIIGVIIAVAVVTSGVGYVLYKRRKLTAPAPPTTSPTEQPPQPTTLQY
jgi:hypothetical protein